MATHESLRAQIVASAADPARRIVIRDVTVITMDPALGDFPRADILIEGETITAVGADLGVEDGAAVVVDGKGFVAVPGLHDTHRHSWQAAFRRMFVDIGLEQYLETLHGRLAPRYRPEDMEIGNLLTGLGALDSGITCVMDFSHNTRSYDHATACIEGWDAAGIRAVYGCSAPAFGEWTEDWPETLRRLQGKHFSTTDQLLTLRACVSAPIIPGIEHMEFSRGHLEHARSLGLCTSVDAMFGPDASNRLVELGRAGSLGPDITYIHCQDLADEAWTHIVDSGGHISLAPTSDANIGQMSAITPVQKALDHGLLPSLGGDVECSLATDLFAQMQAVMSIQRLFAHNARFTGREDPPVPLSSRQVLEFATVGGATANALSDRVGALSAGKAADLVLIDAMSVRSMPLNSALGTVVMGSDSSNVTAVFVAGRARKWDGRLLDVDLPELRRRVEASRDRLIAEAGIERALFV
jgi:cytosine/adenosine deaminase-related metal-dependent hydrolase